MAVYVETRDKRGEFDASEVDADLRTVQAESGAEGLRGFGESEGASLLVVGSSSRTGLGRLRPGETATRLFSSASLGVAVAPLGYADRDGQLSIVGCGYDGGAGAGSALQWAVALCLMRPETQLEVLSAVPRLAFGGATVGALPSRSAQQALETDIQRDLDAAVERAGNPSAIRAVRLAGDPVMALVRESQLLDLLTLGTRGRADPPAPCCRAAPRPKSSERPLPRSSWFLRRSGRARLPQSSVAASRPPRHIPAWSLSGLVTRARPRPGARPRPMSACQIARPMRNGNPSSQTRPSTSSGSSRTEVQTSSSVCWEAISATANATHPPTMIAKLA